MNDKFKEMLLKAQKQAAQETMQNSFAYEGLVFQKFGELIVRESAKFLEENSGYDNANNSWHPEPEDLLEHFGFEPEQEQKKYCPTCGEEWSGTSCGADDCGFIVHY